MVPLPSWIWMLAFRYRCKHPDEQPEISGSVFGSRRASVLCGNTIFHLICADRSKSHHFCGKGRYWDIPDIPRKLHPTKRICIGLSVNPVEQIEDFGVHANQYYQFDVEIFKSSLNNELLALLWNKWVNTLSQSPLISVSVGCYPIYKHRRRMLTPDRIGHILCHSFLICTRSLRRRSPLSTRHEPLYPLSRRRTPELVQKR